MKKKEQNKNNEESPSSVSLDQNRLLYENYIKEANEAIAQNSNNLDNNLLKLSSLFLGGSLTIFTTKNNLATDKCSIYLLYISWVFMIATIVLVFISMHYSTRKLKKASVLADDLYNKNDRSASQEIQNLWNKIEYFNVLNTISFVLSLIFLSLFIILTI